MVAVYIVAGIVILLTILLFLPVRATVCVDSESDITVKYLGITLYPKKSKKKESIKNTGDGAASKKENPIKKLIREKGFSGGIVEITGIVKSVLSSLSYILKHTKISDYRCIVLVASDDAAETAVEYGVVSAAVNGLTAFIATITNLVIDEVRVDSDFSGNTSSLRLFCIISISPMFALIAAIKVAFKIIKIKKDVQDDE